MSVRKDQYKIMSIDKHIYHNFPFNPKLVLCYVEGIIEVDQTSTKYHVKLVPPNFDMEMSWQNNLVDCGQ